ncbi:MAG: hypothetical protein CMF59_14315 [Leptospiraceae bacterium]|nr:hypothetical protein [Leptospiraceae bacterium]
MLLASQSINIYCMRICLFFATRSSIIEEHFFIFFQKKAPYLRHDQNYISRPPDIGIQCSEERIQMRAGFSPRVLWLSNQGSR